MATTTPSLICPQGHGPGVSGSRFCTLCGIQLVPAQSAPAQLVPAQFSPVETPAPALSTVQQTPAWQPVVASQAPLPPPLPAQPTLIAQPSFTAQPSLIPQPVPAAALQPVPMPAIAPPVIPSPKTSCNACGGNGVGLDATEVICTQCGWLRSLLPGYQLDRSVFLWAQDGQAMANLQKIPAINSAVRSASDKVGRPWIESTFNGIRLGPRQLPDVWKQGVLAARILGLPMMPDLYVSGDSQWNTYTFGTDNSSFIVLGTAILTNFQNDEMLFVLAREMGHCRAGHALWKTATRFIVGDSGMHGLLSNGVMNALHPMQLLQGTVELPLLAWARQSDITADRAGLLAVGDEALARRVLLAWSIRSSRLLKQINIEEWMKQEEASDDKMTRFSEMTTSATMYTTRRLRLLSQAAREPELMRWSKSVQPVRKSLAPPPPPPAHVSHSAPPTQPAPPSPAPESKDSIRVVCNKCQAAMRIPLTVLRGKSSLNVRCPQCQNVLTLRPRSAAPTPAPGAAPEQAG